MKCGYCKGKGIVYQPFGEDDVEKEICDQCGGSGIVEPREEVEYIKRRALGKFMAIAEWSDKMEKDNIVFKLKKAQEEFTKEMYNLKEVM